MKVGEHKGTITYGVTNNKTIKHLHYESSSCDGFYKRLGRYEGGL